MCSCAQYLLPNSHCQIKKKEEIKVIGEENIFSQFLPEGGILGLFMTCLIYNFTNK